MQVQVRPCGQRPRPGERLLRADLRLVDADPQGSLTLWHKLRGTNEPTIKTAVNSVSGIVAAARRDGFEWVFIDTPPNVSAVVDDAIKNATMVIIPVAELPSEFLPGTTSGGEH